MNAPTIKNNMSAGTTLDEFMTTIAQEDALTIYERNLTKEVHTLLDQINSGKYDSKGNTVGHEIEGSFLTQDFSIPLKRNKIGINGSIKEYIGFLDAELGDFNFEIQTEPKTLHGNIFQQEEEEMNTKLRSIISAAKAQGYNIHLSGLVETFNKKDVGLHQLVASEPKHTRYLGINNGVMALRQRPIEVDVSKNGKHYVNSFDSIMIESFCNSLQPHILIQKPAKDFADYMNAALVVAGPLMAIAANSPIIANDGPYWDESHVPVFEQSIDSRTVSQKKMNTPRDCFPRQYFDSVDEYFLQTLFKPTILPDLKFGKDENISHPLFRLKLGTDWRWIRPVYFGNEAEKYMTLEFRPLPSGPTIVDMVANSALYIGAVKQLVTSGDIQEYTQKLSAAQASHNFYEGCKNGLQGVFLQGDKTVNATLLVEDLLKRAHLYYSKNNVEASDQLSIIERRIQCKSNPANIKTSLFAQKGLSYMMQHSKEHLYYNEVFAK